MSLARTRRRSFQASRADRVSAADGAPLAEWRSSIGRAHQSARLFPNIVLALVLALAALAPASAAASAAFGEVGVLQRERLSGDWAGLRTELDENGWRPFARYTAGVLGNVRGGRERGARYEGLANWGLDVELGEVLGWKGARFHVQWNSYHGDLPTAELVGGAPSQDVSGWEAETHVRFYTIYLEQRVFSDALRIRVGQLAADDDFFLSASAAKFLNSAFGDFVHMADQGGAPIYPLAAPGLYLGWEPRGSRFFARVGLYAGDVGRDEESNWGFDWADDDLEAALFAETGVSYALRGQGGRLSVGAGGTTESQRDFESGRNVDGLHFFYAMLDHDLFGDPQEGAGVGVFLRAAWIPIEERAPVECLFDGGLMWELGALGRPDDGVGIAFAYHDFGRDFVRRQRAEGGRATSAQTVIEATYRAKLAGWLEFQPTFQWIIEPAEADRDAWVLGAQLRIEL